MTTITLLGLEHSVYTRIARLALEEKNVDYVLEETDIFADDGPPASYLEKQPFGMIPCLVHDGFTLYETTAITRYIDEGFDGKALQPRDPAQRATMNQVISVLMPMPIAPWCGTFMCSALRFPSMAMSQMKP